MAVKVERGTATDLVEVKVPVVTLSLPVEVAETLHQVLRYIGGHTQDWPPDSIWKDGYKASARKHTDAIRQALVEARVPYSHHPCDGHIKFLGFEGE